MTTDSPYIIVLILSVLIALLLFIYLLGSRKHSGADSGKPGTPRPQPKKGKPCPLCGETLTNGERVHSVIYPGKPDKLMEIYGCPFCEKPSAPNKRKCPVCGSTMEADSVLIARVFEKPGKTHVHVLGCSSCYSGRSRIVKKQQR